MNRLFQFGGVIESKKTNLLLTVCGGILLLIVWGILTFEGHFIPPKILPSPLAVVKAFPELWQNGLVHNMSYTIGLNLLGILYALIIAIPLGFILGIYPLPRTLFQKYIDAIRYLPIPCISGIFILIFGLGFDMKASFLAFGVLIYILPTICQKVFDLQNPANDKDFVYLQTIKTLGASNWQKFIYVYWPYVIGRVFTELIALTAITYTYTVICEGLNKTAGVGAMISTMSRQSRTAEVYALLFVIILIGITQDFLLKQADKALFPYKYN
ncbi:ABC transporter permease [Bacteroidia bacterium]|nr:ABC transporter permease [Bacteroidia bacterium]